MNDTGRATVTDLRAGPRAPERPAARHGRDTLEVLVRPDAAGAPAFRPDIEGLRAVAVGLVVAAHAGIPRLDGGYVGVDVFFVISGFLITTLLVKEASRTGTVSLRRFYARRMTRLLPASAAVVLATLVTAWFVAAPTRWASLVGDALASVGYAVNWRFAVQGTDYLQASAPPSPLQHLWSLAVEEQFYAVWPLLVLAVWRRRARHGDQRRTLRLVLTGVVVVSLALSVRQTATSAPWAYFGAHTRAWELAVGALVALSVDRLGRLPGAARAGLAWAGLAMVAAAALLFDDRTAFPGWVALLPVAGTAAAITGGLGAPSGGPGRLLGTAPFQRIGALSYSWYLWHWPFLVLGPVAVGRLPGARLGVLLALASLVVAWASYRFLEDPVRNLAWLRVRPRRGLGLGLALTSGVAALALVGTTVTPALPVGPRAPRLATALARAQDPEPVLRQAIREAVGTRRIPANLTPSVTRAATDMPRVYEDGCHLSYTQTWPDGPCVYGDPAGERTVVLIGDSHGAHWFPTFDALARRHHLRLLALTKSGCQVPSVVVRNDVLKRRYDECLAWRDRLFRAIDAERPALVVMSSNDGDAGGLLDAEGRPVPTKGDRDDALWLAGWTTSVDRLAASGARLVLLQDTPWPQASAPDCIAEHPRRVSVCDRSPDRAFRNPQRRAAVAAAMRARGVTVVDPRPWFCTATACPVVVGDVLVYRDFSHITSRYARALVPVVDRALPWP